MTEPLTDAQTQYRQEEWSNKEILGPTEYEAIAAVRTLLQYIGEDPNREGLRDTPNRVLKAYRELFAGYSIDPEKLVTTFENETYDQIIVLKDCEFTSFCEHHMLPFSGKAHVAYIPNGKVIGISKLARFVELYARRLQIQERLCEQVTMSLMTLLDCRGVACIIEAKHSCMSCRGVNKQHSVMVTSSLKGAFLKPSARIELFNLIRP